MSLTAIRAAAPLAHAHVRTPTEAPSIVLPCQVPPRERARLSVRTHAAVEPGRPTCKHGLGAHSVDPAAQEGRLDSLEPRKRGVANAMATLPSVHRDPDAENVR